MNKYVLYGLGLLLAFAAGRWAAPTKVVTEKTKSETDHKTETTDTSADRNKRKKTTTTEVVKPDGTRETTTVIVEETNTHKETDRQDSEESARAETDKKEVTRSEAKTTVMAIATVQLFNTPALYGAMIYKPILGPIGVGLWGLSNATIGASVGVSF